MDDRPDGRLLMDGVETLTYRSRVRGCLLGGAIGDALGAGIEFHSLDQIRREYGPDGVIGYVEAYGRIGAVTDDTQMVLATIEGLIAELAPTPGAEVQAWPATLHRSYVAWYLLQKSRSLPEGAVTGLSRHPLMAEVRAPGCTCLSGLAGGRLGTPQNPMNPDSKGCGTVMRSAPFGLVPSWTQAEAYSRAVDGAALTHGHPTALVAAGALAMIVREVLAGNPLRKAVDSVVAWLTAEHTTDGAETLGSIRSALRLVDEGASRTPETVALLGLGWVAEEALAIAVFCALGAGGATEEPLLLAVNHSGDSDSTGAITGNLLGAALGETIFPSVWVAGNEAHELTLGMADSLVNAVGDLHMGRS